MQVGTDQFAISLGVRTAQLDMALVRIAQLEQEVKEKDEHVARLIEDALERDAEDDEQFGPREVPANDD